MIELAERPDAQPAKSSAAGGAATIAVLADLIVLRLAAADGATRAEVVRDLAPLAAHRLSPGELREALDGALVRLRLSRLAVERRARYTLTDEGRERVAALYGSRPLACDWPAIRDGRLVAAALGLAGEGAARLKALEHPDSLRAAILADAFGLRLGRSGRISASRLRTKLAVAALDRAFGNRIRTGLGDEKGLSARAGRLLAGQLLQRPRDLGTDSRLIATLAAETIGAVQTDAAALRIALLRRYVSQRLEAAGVVQPPPPEPRPRMVAVSAPAGDALDEQVGPAGTTGTARSAGQRPDMAGFVVAVKRAAEAHAEGWPGNRKAFVCHVWEAIQRMHPAWGLTPVEFKAMLIEAHRTGNLALANADLANKARAKELAASAIPYKNTVWHYVRVEEAA